MKNNKSNQISGAEAVIRCLLAEGVDLIYGYPGGAIMPIYDELYKFQDTLQHVLTRHEQGAAHAAQGYARTSGKVGVAMATSGPGATNLVTGIADAQIDSTPMVCITGQVASHLLGSDAFQETDIIGISTPVTKWNYQITRANEIPKILAKAFYIAKSGRPGPVLIDITKDAQFEEFIFNYEHCIGIRSYNPVIDVDMNSLKNAAEIINKSGVNTEVKLTPHLNISDNFHYAQNIKLPGEIDDTYDLIFEINPPDSNVLGIHYDWKKKYQQLLIKKTFKYHNLNFQQIAKATRR